jgi:hypothetical protein
VCVIIADDHVIIAQNTEDAEYVEKTGRRIHEIGAADKFWEN